MPDVGYKPCAVFHSLFARISVKPTNRGSDTRDRIRESERARERERERNKERAQTIEREREVFLMPTYQTAHPKSHSTTPSPKP